MIVALLLAALAAAQAPPEPEILYRGDDVIWGFDFLPDGRILFTERKGKIRLLNPKTKEAEEVQEAPAVFARGQGGLLDLRLHPRFKENGRVYLSYSEPSGKKSAAALGVAVLEKNSLKGFKRIFSAKKFYVSDIHYGSRIEFAGEHLFLSLGERNDRDAAQDLSRYEGKILRLTHDGLPAAGNPFASRTDALPEIWSYGHRNPQGLVLRPGTNELWSVEFGPRGGDELNRILPGRNYGWPVVTYGREYWGPKIGEGTERSGMEGPLKWWVPSISPSGMAFHQGALYLACLSSRQLLRISLKGTEPLKQESLLGDRGWRFRQLRSGPDGLLYFSTDEGVFGRLAPGPKT